MDEGLENGNNDNDNDDTKKKGKAYEDHVLQMAIITYVLTTSTVATCTHGTGIPDSTFKKK